MLTVLIVMIVMILLIFIVIVEDKTKRQKLFLIFEKTTLNFEY